MNFIEIYSDSLLSLNMENMGTISSSEYGRLASSHRCASLGGASWDSFHSANWQGNVNWQFQSVFPDWHFLPHLPQNQCSF